MRNFIHFAQPLFEKEEKIEILKALDSGWVTLGPRVKQFEEDLARYIGSRYAIAVSSCTAALHLSLLAAGIGKDDEVITTPFTFAATSNTIIHAGAKPVFVDIDPQTFNIDTNKIEEKITRKTRAIVPIHYGGQPAEIDQILKIANKYKLKVIEDAAHAVGTEYKGKRIGSIGDFTCFSFHPIKNISTGDGGMITTNNKNYAEKLITLRLHGMGKDAWRRHSKAGSWKYDISVAGFKYNMTDIQAALGIHQLKKLDRFIAIREKYAKIYNEVLSKIPEIILPFVSTNIRHARNLYSVMIDTKALRINRDELVEELKKANIGASVYFIPLYHFSFYQRVLGQQKRDFPVTEQVYEQIISLPLYPKMKKEDILYIAETLVRLVQKYKKKHGKKS